MEMKNIIYSNTHYCENFSKIYYVATNIVPKTICTFLHACFGTTLLKSAKRLRLRSF